MNDPHDNALDDRAALEKYGTPAHDPVTGEVFDSDAPASGWDKERGIVSETGLDWALKTMAEKESLIRRNNRIAEQEIAFIRERVDKQNAALEKQRRNLEAHVRVYAEANRAALGRYRNLPHGRIEWRRRKVGIYRLDQNLSDYAARKALLEWSLAEEKRWRDAAGGLDVPLTKSEPALNLERVKEYLADVSKQERAIRTAPGLEWVEPGEELVVDTDIKQEES